MKKFLVVALVLLSGVLYADTGVPSVQVELETIFGGIGFALKTGNSSGENIVATELQIARIKQVNLSNPESKESQGNQVIFTFGDQNFPVKVIKPDLNAFEADVVKMTAAGADQPPIPMPIGHISLKIQKLDARHVVGLGKLLINLEDKDKSGEFSLYLNELPPAPAADAKPAKKKEK